MATAHDELHTLIDKLSEQDAKKWLKQIREDVDATDPDMSWHDEMKQLREELSARHGEFPNVADMVNEVREERLNDLMGGR